MPMLSGAMGSMWAGSDGHTEVVLTCVFECLRGRELACAGAACRAWRRAADQPRLWRRLLQAECRAAPQTIRALAIHYASIRCRDSEDKIQAAETEFLEWSWRDEYVRVVAGWRHVCSLRPFDSPETDSGVGDGDLGGSKTLGPTLLHAALAPRGDAIAVTAEDASISVFVRTEPADAWKLTWHAGLVRRGWRAASRVEWAPAAEGEAGGAGAVCGGRLLVAGPLALVERWELLVLQLAAGCGAARVLARAGAAPGAAGCWASHDAFLSLELRLLAPHRAVTTVWLNSATQEEESEFTGVASPVLRVYNEAQAHISHVIVVEAPAESDITEPGVLGADARYIRTVFDEPCVGAGRSTRRLLIAACGRAGGTAGQATALGCWPLLAVTVPRLCAMEGGGLAERVARRRRAPRPDDPDPPVPSEDEMRALCSPPDALCPLQARLLGLAPHPNGRCVWAVEVGGRAVCVTLPALTVLRVLSACDAPPSARPHYVHPALSTQFIASPLGDDGGRVGMWSVRSGALCTAPPPARAAVPCALLPPSRQAAQLLVLAGDVILAGATEQKPSRSKSQPARFVVDRHTTFRTHTGMALPRSLPRFARLALTPGARAASDVPPRESCTPTPAPPCPPCVPHPRPPCRARPADRVQALRVTCCPPPRGMRPPCAPPLPACALDCTQAKPRKERNTPATCVLDESCDVGSDRVAARLAASKDWRRREYMREVCERRPPRQPCIAPYRLPAERECARATDGNLYTIAAMPPAPPAAPTTVSRACGPCREPPPPKCVELVPDNECQVRGSAHVDPCAHRPKVIVSIDRSKTRETNAATSKPSACTQRPSTGGITSRIMKSFNLNRSGGGESSSKCAPRPSGGAGGKAQYAGDTGWCGTIQPAVVPPRCRPPGQAERLRRRACRDIPCRQQPKPPHMRALHTAAPACTKEAPKDMKSMAAQTKANIEKLEKMLNTRASYKEAAKGRVVDCVPKVAVPATGGLELPVPPGAAAIRVKVTLDPAKNACAPTSMSTSPPGVPATTPCAPSASSAGKVFPCTVKTSPCVARAAATTCGAPASINTNPSKFMSRADPVDEKCESSLIKILQKKIANTCRMTETSSKDSCKNPCQPKPSPCAPPPKTIKPSPPQAPCSPPKAPSKTSDSDKKKKKPICFTPALTNC